MPKQATLRPEWGNVTHYSKISQFLRGPWSHAEGLTQDHPGKSESGEGCSPRGASACRSGRRDVRGGRRDVPALRSEPEDSAPHGMRSQNLTGLTKKARDNEALRYRLEATSLDTLGE